MITIEECLSQKLPTRTSLYFKLSSYNQSLFDLLVQTQDSDYNSKTGIFEFPINRLYFLINLLSKYDLVEFKPYKEKSNELIDISGIKFKPKLYKHQLEGVEYGVNHNGWLLLDDQGLGKAVDLYTKVYTPKGFKYMKDIHVGDMVFSRSGKPVKVLHEYYHDTASMYEVTFSDGVTVKCCEDHLWKIHDQHGTKVVPLKWFLKKDQFGKVRCDNLVDSHNVRKYWIDLCEPVEFESQPTTIDPYLLGCLIGDGTLCNHSVEITSADKFIIDEFERRLPSNLVLNKHDKYTYRIVRRDRHIKYNEYAQHLKLLGLFSKKSKDKFVPATYKFNDIQTRLAILQGLLDTDKYAMQDGNCVQFTSVSYTLAQDVVFLVQSLGGTATVTSKACGYRHDGTRKFTGTAYTVTIHYWNPPELFMLPRKRNKLRTRRFLPRRSIVAIRKIPDTPAKCITVADGEGLYLIDNFVVTHNTVQVICLAEALHKKENLKHCLIICGVNGLKWNWAEEIAKFSKLDYKILGQTITKTGKVRIKSVAERCKELKAGIKEFFVITNIETLQHKEFYNAFQKSKSTFDMIVLDEAHKCKNPSSKSAKTLLKLKSKRNIALSGTIIVNDPENAYVPLKWTGNTQSTYSKFKSLYNVYGGFGGVQVIGYKNLELLNELILSCSLRRLKSQVLDLPPKIYKTEYVDLKDSQRKLYNEVAVGIAEQLDKLGRKPTIIEEITINMRLRQITAFPGMLSTEVTQSAKLERLYDLVDEIIAQGDKVVIFSTFKGTADEVYSNLLKYNPVLCTGSQSDLETSIRKKQFQEDNNTKVFVGTWQKCGTGFTLTAASYLIFIDTPWTDSDFQQASDRIYRIGQTKPVTIITLIAKDTYDERVQEIVSRKECLSGYLVDNKNIDKDILKIFDE